MNPPALSPAGGTGLRLRGVQKTFPGGVRVTEPISLDIDPGDFVAIIGPSGCGKSTLLRIIAGLETPTAGTITRSPSAKSDQSHREIAYVFQDAHLLPWRTVLANVALPLELAGVSRSKRDEKSAALLRQVGLLELAGRYPSQLSGGQRMRVSLARAMVTSPDLLLLDEPFAALDEITRQQLDEWLRQLWHERRMTVLFVTHSIQEATFLAERVLVLSGRPARIVADERASAQLPAERTASLRGSATFAGLTHTLYQRLTDGQPGAA